ncbi:zinc finger protein ZAT4 [Cajanus cajan]|uniref:zinc finger protein ZAT4 n=1 Tax=Cajanus cajan TaxID=3821 RepID=UPI00098D7CE2|nr:zinc finger protein ZAT4 [Cajanus cajan]XP_020225790.1 zinc finger protein ZAT4 [Cajanus cajan]
MEEDQEVKHVCKFCSKSFPCGRSLGGHMRSHVTNVSTEAEKASSFNNGGGDMGTGSEGGGNNGGGGGGGYGLRENPKKTWRFTDSSEDTLVVLDKLCKECGKGFHSWKALFGHMKCHSERVSHNNSSLLEDQDSWNDNHNTNAEHEHKVVLDSHSDNEATAPNRRRRSKRRRTRYLAPSTSSVSLVSDAEQEQEEVAMSLMMLSRDVTPWCGLNSGNSLHFESLSKTEGKRVVSYVSEMPKKVTKTREFGNFDGSNLNSKGKTSSELLGTTESLGSGFGVNKNFHGKDKKAELDSSSAFEDNGTEDNGNSKYTSIKAKFLDSELKSTSLRSWVNKPSEGELSKSNNKRGKFECTTCKKIFHSYQALGGHRASHKKIKGCFASRNESSENSTELEEHLSPDPTTTESKLLKNEYVEKHEMVTNTIANGFDNEADTVRESKKVKGHECPICLKVFPSGQALGGHKRSHHLAGGSESARNFQSQTVTLEEAAPEIRDFFDLNLPASTEEEGTSHGHGHAESYRPWWLVGSSHKQEALVGLISN